MGDGGRGLRAATLTSELPAAREPSGRREADAAGRRHAATHHQCRFENYSPQKMVVPFGIGHGGFANNTKPNRKGPMTSLPETAANVSPLVTAGALLLGSLLGKDLGLPFPTVSAILEATGASRSRAYELCGALRALLPTLQRPPGRPAAPCSEPAPSLPQTEQITRAALDFVMRHPGCVHTGRKRAHYGHVYRRFVLELRQRHADIELARSRTGCACRPCLSRQSQPTVWHRRSRPNRLMRRARISRP
jgi:hypothetical protein